MTRVGWCLRHILTYIPLSSSFYPTFNMCKLRGCSQIIFLKMNFNVKKKKYEGNQCHTLHFLREVRESLEKVLRKRWEVLRKYWESPGKVLKKSQDSLRKFWISTEKVLRKSWGGPGKVLGIYGESQVKFLIKSKKFIRESW